MALFSLFFIIFKILVLTTIYSTFVLTILWIIAKQYPKHYTALIQKEKSQLWMIVWVGIGIGLSVYRFTPLGDSGFYDHSRIPTGYAHEVKNSDGYTYIEIDHVPFQDQTINKYSIHNNLVCAEDSDETSFLIYNLDTKSVLRFGSSEEYQSYAKENHLPAISEFKTFFEYYKDYWGGWRFWLLP